MPRTSSGVALGRQRLGQVEDLVSLGRGIHGRVVTFPRMPVRVDLVCPTGGAADGNATAERLYDCGRVCRDDNADLPRSQVHAPARHPV